MRVIFIFLLALVTTAQAQQINPVPDYIFRNQMSVGRNAATDTAAYMSIGPRFGANKGMMPPMVVDTNTVTGSKRNGLFIFSVQKNKYVYWDSVGAKWAEMAGTGGTAINSGDTAAMLLPYIRHAGYGLIKNVQALLVDTLNISTRAWRQKGIDSVASVRVGGTGTANFITKFTAASTIANSQIRDDGTNVGIGVTPGATDLGKSLSINTFGNGIFSFATGNIYTNANTYYNGTWKYANTGFASQYVQFNGAHLWYSAASGTANNNISFTQPMTLTASGRLLIGKITEATTTLDVVGNIANTTGALFATGSGSVGVGLSSATEKFEVGGNGVFGRGNNASYFVELGTGRTNNGAAFIDLVGDATYTDFGLRLIRNNAGANASSSLAHRGTGPLNIYNYDLAPIVFVVDSLEVGRFNEGYEFLINNGGIDSGDYKLQVTGNIFTTGTITTGAPASGTKKPWKLGEAATVSPTSPNRTIRVEIDGVVYYIHAKTTND